MEDQYPDPVNPEVSFTDLRSGNVARGIEWSNGAKDGAEFYAIELFGEVGEALNVIKKLERERLGMVGSRASLQDLADELADAYICVDLLAIAYDFQPIDRVPVANAESGMRHAIALGKEAGNVMHRVLVSETGKRDPELWMMDHHMQLCLYHIAAIAQVNEINLREAVVGKFNKTSDKYGLSTRLARNAELN